MGEVRCTARPFHIDAVELMSFNVMKRIVTIKKEKILVESNLNESNLSLFLQRLGKMLDYQVAEHTVIKKVSTTKSDN